MKLFEQLHSVGYMKDFHIDKTELVINLQSGEAEIQNQSVKLE